MTDYKFLIKTMLAAYRKQVNGDEKVAEFVSKCKEGTATYEDVYAFAKNAGIKMSDTIMQRFVESFEGEDIPAEAIDEVIPPLLREQHETVYAAVKVVSENMNRKAGIGMKCIEFKLKPADIEEITDHFKESGFNDTERTMTHADPCR